MVNPFRYTEPVPREELIDRDAEAARLVATAVEGNNSRLVAPRRYGKTSLLRRVARELPKGWVSVYIDFFGVLTVDDVAERIERAYASQLTGRLRSWFTGLRRQLRPTVRIGGGPVPAGLEIDLQPATASLVDRLALPRRLHERHGRRVFVIFDEFQDVLAAEQRIDAVIRSEIQHHAEAASYAFAGSHVGMMNHLFGDRRRAFYGQARPVDLAPLADVDLAEFIAERFERSGKRIGQALEPLLALVGGSSPAGDARRSRRVGSDPGRERGQRGDVVRGVRPDHGRHPAGAAGDLEGAADRAATRPGRPRRRAEPVLDTARARRLPGGRHEGRARRTDRPWRGRRHPPARIIDPLLAAWIRAGTPGA